MMNIERIIREMKKNACGSDHVLQNPFPLVRSHGRNVENSFSMRRDHYTHTDTLSLSLSLHGKCQNVH